MTYYTHNLNPIALSLGGLDFPWYWLAYIFGFFFVYLTALKLAQKDMSPLPSHYLGDYAAAVWFSVIIGGRLGYVMIYYPSYYWQNPSEIYRIWMGGMSFHGALLLSAVAVWWVARKFGHRFYLISDLICLLCPIALAGGRVANFIGGELAGTPTTLPWGVIFPAYGPEPRHPSQLYQALTEGLLLFTILWWQKNRLSSRPGYITRWFLGGYGTLRFIVEFLRTPDPQLGYIIALPDGGGLSTGQLLCLVMIMVAGVMYVWEKRSE